MPELPEVESARLGLEPLLDAKLACITSISEAYQNKHPKWNIANVTVTKVLRHGKRLFIVFSNKALMIHLGMSGNLRIVRKFKPEKHDHLELRFKDGRSLIFNDPRRFGKVELVSHGNIRSLLNYETFPNGLDFYGMGPDAFDRTLQKPTMQAFAFWSQALSWNSPVKALLLDQSIVSGIGNIYADEILFQAKVSPFRLGSSLTKKEIKAIAEASPKILKKAILLGGSTTKGANPYVNVKREKGRMQEMHQVYGRAGELCFRCESKLRKGTVSNRTTVFCKNCQH